jgi:lipoprotein NlpI
MNRLVFIVIGFVAMLMSGCSLTQTSPQPTVLLATPLQVTYASEVALSRLGQMINSGEYSDEQLAQIYYERGVVFDRVGLKALAQVDFNRAIDLKPDYAQAYNFMGVYYTQSQEFDNAFEAFDSAVELAPDYDYAYFSRAVALYYANKIELARRDIDTYYAMDPSDAYRVLWRFLLTDPIDAPAAKLELQASLDKYDDEDWGWRIVRFFNGQLNEAQLLNSAIESDTDNEQLAERLCEAYFYLAKNAQAHQQSELAENYFKLALSSNVYEFIEHRYSLLELERSDLSDPSDPSGPR